MIDEPVQQERPLSVGDWMLTLFLTAIPILGIIMLFVWAFGSNTPTSKANWAKAALIWILIITVLYGVIFAIFGVAMFSADM